MIIKDMILDGIPVTEYQKEDRAPRRLLFFFHGFTGERKTGVGDRAEALADLGFLIVAPDAYLHGERSPTFFANWDNSRRQKEIVNIIIRTAREAELIYRKYYKDKRGFNTDAVYAYGVSMGAAIALYLASFMPEAKTAVSIVGSPSFCAFYERKREAYGFARDEYYAVNLASYRSEDPLLNWQRFKGKSLFLSGGTEDVIVPPVYAEELSELLRGEDVVFKKYATGHESTPEMTEDSYRFLSERLARDIAKNGE